MKKTILSALSTLLIFTASFAQKAPRQLDPSNMREGETVEYCHQHVRMQELLKDPAMMQLYLQDQAESELNKSKGDHTKGQIYRIPVVFHVLHNGGIENISDEQIMDALDILNRDYRLLNLDANNVQLDFDGTVTTGNLEPQPSDAEIEFVLATKAPDGTCFKGITRTQSVLSYDGSDGDNQVTAIRNGNDVYQGTWQGNRYMNVFICGDIGGAAGYTYKPLFGGTGMTNGIWILHNYVGSIGTSSESTSRTLTHEAGHWFNLDHTWGGNNNPGNTTSCNSDDAVQDTPNCIGVTACALNSNTCNSDDAFFGFPIRDNVENYMDYSYCSKMFTQGQVTRMRNALNSSNGGRSNLWTSGNLTLTGATGDLSLCKAEFYANRTTICAGETVQFSDDSYNAVSGWNWSFPSGTPSSSIEQNPSVTYATPGVYEVTLTATDGTTTDGETKTAYIRVLPPASSIPFFEGFENYSTLDNIAQWQVYNFSNNNKFTLEPTFGQNSSKCVKLVNFGQAEGSIDELHSSSVDLSSINSTTGVTLSFRYAYRKRVSANTEYLKVFISANCGESWAQRKTLSGNALGSVVVGTSWTPTPSDWVTVHMTNVTADYWVDNFRYKFRFEGDNGNNIYLDNINIYPGTPSEDIVLGVAEAGEIEELVLYPNPTEGELNVRFSVGVSQAALMQIQDVSGKIIKTNVINALEGANLVVIATDDLATGSYFLNVQIGGTQKTLQFVVK